MNQYTRYNPKTSTTFANPSENGINYIYFQLNNQFENLPQLVHDYLINYGFNLNQNNIYTQTIELNKKNYVNYYLQFTINNNNIYIACWWTKGNDNTKRAFSSFFNYKETKIFKQSLYSLFSALGTNIQGEALITIEDVQMNINSENYLNYKSLRKHFIFFKSINYITMFLSILFIFLLLLPFSDQCLITLATIWMIAIIIFTFTTIMKQNYFDKQGIDNFFIELNNNYTPTDIQNFLKNMGYTYTDNLYIKSYEYREKSTVPSSVGFGNHSISIQKKVKQILKFQIQGTKIFIKSWIQQGYPNITDTKYKTITSNTSITDDFKKDMEKLYKIFSKK